jgi:hypothetical protein
MSTRSIIVVHGKAQYSPEVFRLYKHHDGYPTENLRIIAEAIERGNAMVEEQKKETPPPLHSKTLSADTLTGLLVGAATSLYGMGAQVEFHGSGDLKAEHFGDQSDLEWIYVIDTDTRSVRVFGGGYSGDWPAEVVARGTVDPLNYVRRLKPEFQAETKATIRELVKRIKAARFAVNPETVEG